MKIAFYAPLKSPHHPTPSGDRRIARLLIRVLESAGHQVELMSELRTWEGRGDPARQEEIRLEAEQVAEKIVAALQAQPPAQRPHLWFSYHLYHKAPDWIGPRVCDALEIPYVVAEASYAAKQAGGAWSAGLEQVRRALELACAIICLNPRDIPGIRQLPGCGDKLQHVPPFTDLDEIRRIDVPAARQSMAARYQLQTELPWLVSVAMMRDDAKLDSYRQLAGAVERLAEPFQLLLVGDGRAREQVESLFAGSAQHTRFLGRRSQSETLEILQACDLFVWPAVNEAIGMAILEAQACGLPVIAGNSGAIAEIVSDGTTGRLFAPGDIDGMLTGIRQLLSDVGLRNAWAGNAREKAQQHSLGAVAGLLDQILSECRPE